MPICHPSTTSATTTHFNSAIQTHSRPQVPRRALLAKMARDNWSLISRLKRAVKKINFIIKFNVVNRFKIASILGRSRSSSSAKPRRLSFNDRPGLKAAAHFYCSSDEDEGVAASSYYASARSSSSRGSSSSRELHRTTSCPASEDVDKRADAFIANFYRQLRMERQVSLQLRYGRGNSFDSSGLRSP
uniref:DUF761 domain-containing protein n=1 Tax=Kalanchoe fedtschenkoi TaxID=63787 RepID=A0A7N0RG47_KALFE